jgi:AcrR family transcriptional regulator
MRQPRGESEAAELVRENPKIKERTLVFSVRIRYTERKTSARFLRSWAKKAGGQMPKVTAAHEQQRRDQILEAAMACFARTGYRATSMGDIVRESGLSVGAIYSYFVSKDELFLALCRQRTEQMLAAFNDLYDGPGSLAEKNRAAVELFFQQLSEDLAPYARVSFEFWSEAPKSEALQEQRAAVCHAFKDFLVSLIVEGKRQGVVRPDIDDEAVAQLVLALDDGILMHHVSGIQPIALDRLERAYVALLNNGLATPSASFLDASPSASSLASATDGNMPMRGVRHDT